MLYVQAQSPFNQGMNNAAILDEDIRTTKVIACARTWLGSRARSSAELCLADAVEQQKLGADRYARARALCSLKHSVGVFHHAYLYAEEIVNGANELDEEIREARNRCWGTGRDQA